VYTGVHVWGTSLSWNHYLHARSFVDHISTSGREAGRSVSMEILRQTREVIASNEALARENIRVREGVYREHMATIEASTDRIVGELSAGFGRLSYGLQDVSSGIADLNATFHWGFGAPLKHSLGPSSTGVERRYAPAEAAVSK
jgi:hypothetical protein